ncbi:uncharacterized protein BXZ73DRAFT_98408 [Epithele typhae]|uniref:uncharacterized protein n=1 Tax=Epithele typhae TaxID=378194 RepID=UPI0020083F18|nr:uncharacterized protein BXZ73DRAFT_98408 [Epithele typhae]KAH9941193.1 hypothetical protein BXZ73DRAFT_98408 [Epithele typhae]
MGLTFTVQIRILATALPAIAIILTSLRLYYRASRRHLGWDDAWAASAIFCAFFLTAGAWTRSDIPGVGPFNHSVRVRILGYYMLQVAFTCVLWVSRLSILFSIIRLIPTMMRLRIVANICAFAFGFMWIGLVILKLVVCETNTEWKSRKGVQCVLGEAVASVEIATDFLADLALVLLPLRLLWRISLPPGRRALLIGIFSASILTTIASIVHCVYVFSPNRNAEGIWAHVLASTCMMVANLAVLVTWLLRSLGYSGGSEPTTGMRTPGVSDGSAAKGTGGSNLTTLRFHSSNPIVLTTLDQGSTTRWDNSTDVDQKTTPSFTDTAAGETGKSGAAYAV